jgi:hypothetical protein
MDNDYRPFICCKNPPVFDIVPPFFPKKKQHDGTSLQQVWPLSLGLLTVSVSFALRLSVYS